MKRRLRPKHLPIIVAWAAIIGVVYWIGSNPRLVAPYLSGLVSKHLLHLDEGGLRVRDFRVRVFEGLDLYGVSLTIQDRDRGLTLVSADTVAVDFSLGEVLGKVPHLRRLTVARPEVYSRTGSDSQERVPDRGLQLPALVVEHLAIRDALLEVSDSGGRLIQRISDLDWKGPFRAEEDVEFVLQGCAVDWDTHQSLLTGLRGTVRIDEQEIRVEGLNGFLNGNKVRIDGIRTWDGGLDIDVTAEGVSVAEVENLIDMAIGFNALGNIQGSFATRGDTLLYSGEFTGDLEGYQMEGLTGRAIILLDEVLLEDLAGTINGARFSGGGRFDVSDPLAVSFVLEGHASDVDLTRGLIPGEDDLPATGGRGRLRIEHTDLPEWTHVTGVMHEGFIDIIPFDTCLVDVEATPELVRFNGLKIKHRELTALLSGASDSKQVFAGSLEFQAGDLATLPAHWGWPALAGVATGQGELNGPLDDLTFRGELDLRRLVLANVRADRGRAALTIADVLEDPQVTGDISGRGLTVGGVDLGAFELQGLASALGARVDAFRSDLGDTAVSFGFRADFQDSVKDFLLDRLTISLEGTDWEIAEPVPFGVAPGYFSLPEMILASDQGALHLGLFYDAKKIVTGAMELQSFDLGLLNPFVPTEEPLRGRLTADLVIHGDPEAPVVDLTGDLVDAPFSLAHIDTLHVQGGFSRGTVFLNEVDLLTGHGRIKAKGSVAHPGTGVEDFWPGADLDLRLEIVDGDWAFLEQFELPALDRLAGRFTGNLDISGTTAAPIMQGDLHCAPFDIHWLHLDELTGSVWVDNQTMVLGELRGNQDQLALTGRIEIPVDLDLLSEPVTPLDGPFFMQLVIPEGSDLEPLSRATNAFVTCSGTGAGQVIIAGPLERPVYQGEIALDGVGFVLRNLEEVYADASCRARFSGDRLHVDEISGREGLRGTFSGDGTVDFNGLELETFDINLDLDRFLVASIPDLAVLIRGQGAHMTGVKVGPDSLLVPRFSGNLEVIKAEYTGDFSESGGGSADPMQATVAPDWLADLSLHAEPRVARILNRDLELDMGGDLDLVRNEEGLYLRGTLDINSGRLIVFNNNFEVVLGSLDFSREVGFDPRIDLDAETKYRLTSAGSSNSVIERIGVHVTGTLFQPRIRFSSERGYSREAIQRMLLGLEPEATPAGDRQRLANSSITAGFNLLEREISRELDIFDTFEIDQIQRLRDPENPDGSLGLDPLIGVGKYIGSDLYLKYAQGVRQDDRDFLVEYQINAHLLLQSEIRRRIDENQGQSTYNLDLKYRFEY